MWEVREREQQAGGRPHAKALRWDRAKKVHVGGVRGDGMGRGVARPGRGGGMEHLPSPSLAPASLRVLTTRHSSLAKPWASPELPCDISKEAFAQENISLSQSSLKAGWCPSNGLTLGPATAVRPAPHPPSSSVCPGSCLPRSHGQQVPETFPEVPGRLEGDGSLWKQHGALQGS